MGMINNIPLRNRVHHHVTYELVTWNNDRVYSLSRFCKLLSKLFKEKIKKPLSTEKRLFSTRQKISRI